VPLKYNTPSRNLLRAIGVYELSGEETGQVIASNSTGTETVHIPLYLNCIYTFT